MLHGAPREREGREVGEWSECEAQCGGGWQTRAVACEASSDEECLAARPPEERGSAAGWRVVVQRSCLRFWECVSHFGRLEGVCEALFGDLRSGVLHTVNGTSIY